ncbi:hypothetical protein [Thalassotalea sp. SU-HH00458]|uniref:hypothetical protein n=1 Tax=Thalassotalea sp. SU-HH00458 TaxID=3127657 RepID=UPI0031060EB2
MKIKPILIIGTVLIIMATASNIYTNQNSDTIILYSLNLLALLGITTTAFIANNISKNYLSEKGKNQAVIEDIKKITALVEEVKSEFTKESAILTSQLQVVSGSKLSLKEKEKDILINLNIHLFKWLEYLGDIDVNSVESCNHYEERLKIIRLEMKEHQTTFTLLIGSHRLINTYNSINLKICQTIMIPRQKQVSELKKLALEIDLSKTDIEEYKRLSDIQLTKYSNYINFYVECYKQLLKDTSDFQQQCREFLYSTDHSS